MFYFVCECSFLRFLYLFFCVVSCCFYMRIVFMCVFVYVCVGVCICVYECMYVCMYLCMDVCMYVCVYVYVCMCMYVYVYVCICISACIFIRMFVYICMCVYVFNPVAFKFRLLFANFFVSITNVNKTRIYFIVCLCMCDGLGASEDVVCQ